MQLSQVPTKIPAPWASSAPPGNVTTPIPPTSQIGIVNGAASWPDGFPPLTFIPTTGGGIPPFGRDFNGILKTLSSWDQWESAGGTHQWDAAFSSTIGGYPQWAIVSSNVTLGLYYFCTIDNNASNPDAGGAGWIAFSPIGVAAQTVTASGAFTTQRPSVRLARTVSVGNSSTTLPASPVDGQTQFYADAVGNFNAFPLTINAAAGQTIIGGLTAAVLNVNGQVARFEYVSATQTWTFKP